ncbi:hypothetical protein ONZ45_g5711 [Pleurotus djamor]|nr:hypothetical protein ONZ45_g5711 [Pleurotus djamor]
MFASTYYFTILSLAGPIHAYPIVQATSWFTSLLSAVDDHDEIFGSPLCFDLVISVVLVLAGGVFAGLTIGLMGLDELHLRVLASSSDDQREKRNAQKSG